jgi:hypothetical protein
LVDFGLDVWRIFNFMVFGGFVKGEKGEHILDVGDKSGVFGVGGKIICNWDIDKIR